MKLRTRINLVVAGLTAAFVLALILAEVQSARASVREEIVAANRVAMQLLGRLAESYSRQGGAELVLVFLDELGRVRSNDIILRSAAGEELYRSPPSTWKAGRHAPQWFARLLAPQTALHIFPLERRRAAAHSGRSPRAPSSMRGTTSRACWVWRL